MDVFLVPKLEQQSHGELLLESPVGNIGLKDLAKPMPALVLAKPQALTRGGFRVRQDFFDFTVSSSALLGLTFSPPRIPDTLKVTSLILGLLDGTTKPPPQKQKNTSARKDSPHQKRKLKNCSFRKGTYQESPKYEAEVVKLFDISD